MFSGKNMNTTPAQQKLPRILYWRFLQGMLQGSFATHDAKNYIAKFRLCMILAAECP